jgi:hypothetical protein
VPAQQAQPAQATPPTQTWQQPQPAAPAWQQPQQPQAAQPQWGAQPQQYAQPPAKKKGNAPGAIIAFVGAIILVAGAFAQWLRTNIETYSGWDVSIDGKVVVGLAVGALLVGFVLLIGVRSVILRLALLAIGVWAIVIAIVDSIDVGNQPDNLEPAIGVGLILVGVGGVVLLLAGLVARSKAKPAV